MLHLPNVPFLKDLPFLFLFLKHSWFTVFEVYSKVIVLYMYIHIYMYVYLYILFQLLFYYRLLQDTEYSSLCYTVGPCCLSINPKLLIYPSPASPFGNHKFVFCVSKWLLWSPLHLFHEKRIPAIGLWARLNTRRPTLESWDRCCRERGIAGQQGQRGAAHVYRASSQRLPGAGFVVQSGWGIPWSPQKAVMGLFKWFCRRAGDWALLLGDGQEGPWALW